MKRFSLASVVVVSMLAFGLGNANAAPVGVTLTVNQAQSGILVTVAALGSLTGTVSTSLFGTQDITLDDTDPLASALSFDGGALGLTDASLFLNLAPLGGVNAGFIGATSSGLVSTGTVPLTYTGGSWNYSLDPGDTSGGNTTSLTLNGGVLTYTGTGAVGDLLGSGTLDFATDPAGFDLPEFGQIATLTQTLLGSTGVSTTYSVVLSAPISVSQNVITDPVAVSATIQGQIVASGTYIVVPEPSTMVLLGIALAGLVPLYRRMKK